MDALDREICSLLQADGRMSLTDLAAQVGLSVAACHRRVKQLEASDTIVGYRATINPEALGLGFEAVVFITMGRTDLETIAAFEAAVIDEPEIVSAQRLFGETDYMLRVLTKNLASYQRLYDETLGTLPGVLRATSTMVMKRLGDEHSVPL
ncbi:Lrp/AsnC family transcriptional regulator [Gulosibacter bifidus]|uniref:Lrp/AsnC family transcriptional regulator n=1 Tax=Gulosibacter bifidus TaxID=272239 RepID=A0ABW5RI73_9MICO|nr:Lrp/AsnC family transcriptional regulator [Gulosibacter bifidus]